MFAEAKTGYCLKSIVYSGKASFPRYRGVSLLEQVVVSLVERYENKGHIVYIENFYSAPSLFKKLGQRTLVPMDLMLLINFQERSNTDVAMYVGLCCQSNPSPVINAQRQTMTSSMCGHVCFMFMSC